MTDIQKETDSLGVVEVAADKLWGAQTQRSLEHFSIGTGLETTRRRRNTLAHILLAAPAPGVQIDRNSAEIQS